MPSPREATGSLELLRRLTLAGVDFVVVGGVAATLHGSSLVTVDLDLCTPFTEESFARALPVLVALEARFRAHPDRPPLVAEPARFAAFRHLLLDTREGPLDLLRAIDGVGEYDAVAASSEWVELGGFRVRVLGLEALISAKRAVGREKDLRALAELEAVRELRRQRASPARSDEES